MALYISMEEYVADLQDFVAEGEEKEQLILEMGTALDGALASVEDDSSIRDNFQRFTDEVEALRGQLLEIATLIAADVNEYLTTAEQIDYMATHGGPHL